MSLNMRTCELCTEWAQWRGVEGFDKPKHLEKIRFFCNRHHEELKAAELLKDIRCTFIGAAPVGPDR